MTTAEIRARLEDMDEVLTMDGYDDAIVGVAEVWAADHSRQTVVCYDYAKCIEALLEDSDMSADEAEEFFEFNCVGAYVGELTPVFLHDWRHAREPAKSDQGENS